MENEKGLMTKGVIWKQILWFSLPLLLGNLFQQLYNTVDSIVVGQTIGSNALAAVGSSNPIINLLVSFFMGLSVGASVIISQSFGAQDKDRLHKAVHTSIALAIVGGLILMVVGILLTPLILTWVGTPPEVMDGSKLYLRIYFAGILGVVIYNIGSGILRAIGDSKTPLYFLIASALTNIVLDLVFVIALQMGVAGVAWATTISQALSGILILIVLSRTDEAYRLVFREIRFDSSSLKQIIKIGLPSGLQNAVISFSNVIVQSNINSFGPSAMAGCGSYTKIDGFAILPIMSFSMAMTTFIGQNMGANEYERVNKGAKIGLLMCCGTAVVISGILLLFAPNFLRVFSNEEDVIYYGTYMLRSVAPGYIFLAVSHALSGTLRGAGKTLVPMVIMIATWCIMRMTWIITLMPVYQDIYVVFSGYVVTWFSSALIIFIYYKKGHWLQEV